MKPFAHDIKVEIFKLEQWIITHSAKMEGFLCVKALRRASREAALLSDARKCLATLRVAVNEPPR